MKPHASPVLHSILYMMGKQTKENIQVCVGPSLSHSSVHSQWGFLSVYMHCAMRLYIHCVAVKPHASAVLHSILLHDGQADQGEHSGLCVGFPLCLYTKLWRALVCTASAVLSVRAKHTCGLRLCGP